MTYETIFLFLSWTNIEHCCLICYVYITKTFFLRLPVANESIVSVFEYVAQGIVSIISQADTQETKKGFADDDVTLVLSKKQRKKSI